MRYFEVLLADPHYHGTTALTYGSTDNLPTMSVVNVPMRGRNSLGIISKEVDKPAFTVKSIKGLLSTHRLPAHTLELARWLGSYYSSTLAEALRQFVPASPSTKNNQVAILTSLTSQLEWQAPLTKQQVEAIKQITASPSTTVLLHGETGSGKTRVYLELANRTLSAGNSVVLLTPEISLTAQLAQAAKKYLNSPVFVVHSQLSAAQRRKIWLQILEADEPIVVIGARSALFSPVKKIGLIVVDEAHEPAYKQSQSPRYHASRIASQIGSLTGAKVILGTATPLITDYYLANTKKAVIRMSQLAIPSKYPLTTSVVDIKDRANFSLSNHLSTSLIDAIKATLIAKKQIIIYLNRRGSARLILCKVCGWQLLCPNCDIPLVYHGDEHLTRCHTCGFKVAPPVMCPACSNPDIVYKSVGTKALAEEVQRLFPEVRVRRFDSDNLAGERLNELYEEVLAGKVNILVGTQLLAKGLDLPHLGLVGIISAETSLSLPDFSAEERSFQLLYQIIGRVGRGHTKGQVILQSLEPNSQVIEAAAARDWQAFYNYALAERQAFRFPPFSYLAQLVCKKTSQATAEKAAGKLKEDLGSLRLPLEIIGPSAPFYAKRGDYYYCQLVIKAKKRSYLTEIAKHIPAGWQINLDPSDLL